MSDEPGLIRQVYRSGAVTVVFRLVIGGLFIYMGLKKAIAPVDFLHLIREYKMFPDSVWWLLNFTVATLPWVEMLCGLLLVLGMRLRGTALLIMTMLAVFTPMIFLRGQAIYAQQQIDWCKISFDCGCGAGVVNFCAKLAENTALFLGALCILFSRKRRFYLHVQFVR